MKNFIKTIFKNSPTFVKILFLQIRGKYYEIVSASEEKKNYPLLPLDKKNGKEIKNILIYHISGMYYAGTEKNLQLIANQLAGEYNVFFMYSLDNFSQTQRDLMNSNVHLIEFKYGTVDNKFPYFIRGMNPHIKNVIEKEKIDLIISSSSGHSQYPLNAILNIPIIIINIFGSPAVQKNIVATVFISKSVQDYSEKFTGKKKSNGYAHLAVSPPTKDLRLLRKSMREKLNIREEAFVFGRIGRKSDAIFDPIGINAFKEVVKIYPEAHYLIMSSPPILEKIVKDENIPNVHFISDTVDIWDFYSTLDALAHFRFDGETFGLNIAEAMYAGNPIISHKSHIWNAHLEYLLPTFSRIAQKDNIEEYSSYMQEFINLKKENPQIWEGMREEAKRVALDNFNEKKYGDKIKSIIKSI